MKTPTGLFALFMMLLTPSLVQFASVSDPVEMDDRLAQKITYAGTRVTLQKLAEDLTKQTGVTIKVGNGDRDWQVKERTLHVSFQKIVLGAVLKQIAQTLGYQLHRSGSEGAWIYRIWQPTTSKDYEALMRQAMKEEAEQKVIAQREAALRYAEDTAAITPEDAMKRKEEDPWTAFLAGTEGGRAYGSLLRNLPIDARELLLRGRKVTLELSDLSPQAQKDVQNLIPPQVRDKILESMGPKRSVFESLTPTQFVFQPITQEMGADKEQLMGAEGMLLVLGEPKERSKEFEEMMKGNPMGRMGRGLPMASLPLTGGNNPISRAFGEAMIKIEGGEDPAQVIQAMQARMNSEGSPEKSKNENIVPSPTPTDPRLLAEIEPLTLDYERGKEPLSAQIIRQLQEKTPLSLILEYYPRERERLISLPREKTPLYRILDALQTGGFTWKLDQNTVQIHPKDWAVQRSYDIPKQFMEPYRRRVKEKKPIDLETLSLIAASLTDEQIQYRFLKDDTLRAFTSSLTSIAVGNRALLRLYAGLNPSQKARVVTPKGLAFSELSLDQWQKLAAILEDEGAAEADQGSLTLAIEPVTKTTPEIKVPANKKPIQPAKGEPASVKPSSVGRGDEDRRATFTLKILGERGKTKSSVERVIELPSAATLQKRLDEDR